jgi:hypothetical protein
MKDLWRTYKEWNDRRWARVSAKGAWFTFLYCMAMGLLWGIFMLATTSLLDLYFDGYFRIQSLRIKLPIYVIGSLIMGLVFWVIRPKEAKFRKLKE